MKHRNQDATAVGKKYVKIHIFFLLFLLKVITIKDIFF